MNETSRLSAFVLLSVLVLAFVGWRYGIGPTLAAIFGLCAIGYTVMPTVRDGVH